MTTKTTDLVERSVEILPEIIKWRRHFHQFPELSFQEKATSETIVQILRSFDVYTIETKVGGYGVVATLTSGEERPVIGLRADMDALPIYEQTELSYSSKHPGVMHACGHDAHIAILLGAAKLLAEDAKNGLFKGTVKLIFQPAEENCDVLGETGAMKMLESGALDDVEAVFALHVCPWLKSGEIQVNDGPSMANNDDFHLIIKGNGGHGGYPHHTNDPVWMSTYLLQALYSLNGRRVDPLEVGTISVGQIHAGEANNVIPGLVEIQGTVRSYKNEVRELLIKEIGGPLESLRL
ncbi:M20 metallopeptidase family protein [Halobacillus amylolyticus]|uniref:M20 metallopeptidase family protein n=1 Tax=Halobacillus amylolyticus TaxID=2932259 RepID=UPI0029620135|nr:amidohydrolase [Halobacillus amylolyticus]